MVRQTDNVGPSDKPDVWTLVELSAWTNPQGTDSPLGLRPWSGREVTSR